MPPLKMLTTDDKVAEIRRLYFETTKPTIQADLEKALDLLKSMPSEEERDRVAVYMDGLAQMRTDWGKGSKASKGVKGATGAKAARGARGATSATRAKAAVKGRR